MFADGEHTAAPDWDLPVGVLLEIQHLCTLPVPFTVLRLANFYPLPLLFLFRQTLIWEPCCQQVQAAAVGRQLQPAIEGS